MVANAGGEEIGVEDAASVALRFRSGALATLHVANALPRPGLEGHVAIRGSLGSVTLTPDGRLHRTGPGSREDPRRSGCRGAPSERSQSSAWVILIIG